MYSSICPAVNEFVLVVFVWIADRPVSCTFAASKQCLPPDGRILARAADLRQQKTPET